MAKWLTLVVDADALTPEELEALTGREDVRKLAWGDKLDELETQLAEGRAKDLQLQRQAALLQEGDRSFQEECRQRFLKVLGSRGTASVAG